MGIAASVIIVTKNAAHGLASCLDALSRFDEVIIVDSHSTDHTAEIAAAKNVMVIPFEWNGQYPKKRQWVLQNVPVKNEWIFFVDADEIVTEVLAQEIADIIAVPQHDAYFVLGQPVFCGERLKYGRWNNKITLFRKSVASYPEFPDAHIDAMGEIEGHYQPKISGSIGQLKKPLIHVCAETIDAWIDRHQRYATWQAEIEARGIDLAVSETGLRAVYKRAFQDSFGRAIVMFMDSYIAQQGFRDGMAGLHYAVARGWYYWLISVKKRVFLNKASGNSVSDKS